MIGRPRKIYGAKCRVRGSFGAILRYVRFRFASPTLGWHRAQDDAFVQGFHKFIPVSQYLIYLNNLIKSGF